MELEGKETVMGRKALSLIVIAAVCCSSVLFYFIGQVSAKESRTSDDYHFLKTFTDVLALVERNYVESVKLEQLVEGAVKGMLQTLDPHSSYMPADMFKELQVETKGQFGGLGIEITVKEGLLTVVSPIEDSPAVRAGVESGDQIIKIGDEFTKDISLIDAVKMLRGPKGTPVTISVHREGRRDLIPITVIRDVIKVRSIRSRMLEEGYGYIRLAQFQEGSAGEFIKELEKLNKKSEIRGLVLDLRNNPGGLLNQAVRVSDIFLKDGVIVYTEGRLESQKQKYYAHDDGTEPNYPLIVLVNGGSASASEIVAGAFQDHGRAVILGQQSFGKGSVQTILPMERGDALRLTTALYFTTSGRSIQAEGVTPDIVVSDKRYPADNEELLETEKEEEESPELPKERDLPRSFKNPKGKETEDKEPNAEQKTAPAEKGAATPAEEKIRIGSREAMNAELAELLKEDPQLDEALRLLKTWHVFKGKPTVEAKEGATSKDLG